MPVLLPDTHADPADTPRILPDATHADAPEPADDAVVPVLADDAEAPEPVAPPPGAADRSDRGRPAALLLAGVCAEFRGRDTAVLDLSAVTPMFDYFVVATGTSRRQMVALAEEADKRMKRAGSRKRGGEGDETGIWIVRDYGDVVLHVLSAEARELYDLEGLWGDAERVDWRPALGLPPAGEDASPAAPSPADDLDDAA